ncbi:hypothetical protein ES703_91724 [subsurface metagenome]
MIATIASDPTALAMFILNISESSEVAVLRTLVEFLALAAKPSGIHITGGMPSHPK